LLPKSKILLGISVSSKFQVLNDIQVWFKFSAKHEVLSNILSSVHISNLDPILFGKGFRNKFLECQAMGTESFHQENEMA